MPNQWEKLEGQQLGHGGGQHPPDISGPGARGARLRHHSQEHAAAMADKHLGKHDLHEEQAPGLTVPIAERNPDIQAAMNRGEYEAVGGTGRKVLRRRESSISRGGEGAPKPESQE